MAQVSLRLFHTREGQKISGRRYTGTFCVLWFEMAGKTSSKFDKNRDDRIEVTIDLQQSMMLSPRHVLQLHKIGLD